MIGFHGTHCLLFGQTGKRKPIKDKIIKPIKVLIWGWMGEYNKYIDRLRCMEADGSISIIGITGKEIPPYDRLDGYPLIKAERAFNRDYEQIFVFAETDEKEAITSCIKCCGASRDTILPGRLLDLQGFDIHRYLRFRREGLSIFANACWSGLLCQTLAIEHRSPTKNLFFEDADYLRFITNLSYYLTECEPVFDKWHERGYEGQPLYPVLKLGDIRLYCNHSDDPNVEIEKWKRRTARVNPDHMLFEFSSESPYYVNEFLSLHLPGRKICMTSVETSHPDAVVVHTLPGETWLRTVHAGVLEVLPYYSLLNLALGDRPFIRFQ